MPGAFVDHRRIRGLPGLPDLTPAAFRGVRLSTVTHRTSRRASARRAPGHNRDRLIIHDADWEFLRAIAEQARKAKLMSADHFTVDGTLIESWAFAQDLKKRDEDNDEPPDDRGNSAVDFHGEKRTNDTHESTTDSVLFQSLISSHAAVRS